MRSSLKFRPPFAVSRARIRGGLLCAASAAALLSAGDAAAQQVCAADSRICGFVDLSPEITAQHFPSAISADGGVIIGQVRPENGVPSDFRAFRWTRAGGMVDLGAFRADGLGISRPGALSADGSVIVGSAESDLFDINGAPRGAMRAFRWTEAGGMQDLGTLQSSPDGGGSSGANSVSADGSVIVGSSATDTIDDGGFVHLSHAFRWTEATGMQDLGTLFVDENGWHWGSSSGRAVSADGSTVIGWATARHPGDNPEETFFATPHWNAFRWTEAGGMQSLGSLHSQGWGFSSASAVSADGSVIVGASQADPALIRSGDNPYALPERAFRWTEAGGMQDLGALTTDGRGESSASFVSADGSVVVGSAQNDDTTHPDLSGRSTGWRAFRWTEAGGMADLGTLRADGKGGATAAGMSADGSVVVGRAETDTTTDWRAFRWTEAEGMNDLGTLRADGQGSSQISAISADGSIILGEAASESGARGFIWREEGSMEDLTNLRASFPILADEAQIAAAAQQAALSGLAGANCDAFGGRSCLQASGSLVRVNGDSAEGVPRSGLSTGSLSYGYGLTDQVVVGAGAAALGTRLDGRAVETDLGGGLALWADYSQTGAERVGLQGGAAVAWGRQKAEVTRGLGLDNVALARGDTHLDTTLAQARVGYGFASGAGWTATPSLTLEHARTRLGGYEESGANFSADYNRSTTSRTTLKLALDGEIPFGESGRFTLGGGVAHDLSASRARASGVTDLPGLEAFDAASALERKDTRAFASVGYRQNLTENAVFSASLGAEQAAYGGGWGFGANLGFGLRF